MRSFYGIIRELSTFLREHFPYGITWSSTGVAFEDFMEPRDD